MSYYDSPTNTTYYDPQMVINITEFDADNDKDSNIFIIFDHDESLFYIYGSRGIKSSYNTYMKTLSDFDTLYDFIYFTTGQETQHLLSISVNFVSDMTNYDEYYEILQKVNRDNEVVAYDNVKNLTKEDFKRYVFTYLGKPPFCF